MGDMENKKKCKDIVVYYIVDDSAYLICESLSYSNSHS